VSNAPAIALLQPEHIDRAYGLMKAGQPGLSCAGWRAFCLQALRRRQVSRDMSDIVVATDDDGEPQAICLACDPNNGVRHGMLDVWCFFLAPNADQAVTTDGMIAYLSEMARSRSCRAVRFWVGGRDAWVSRVTDQEDWERGVILRLAAAPSPDEWRPVKT